MQHAMLARLSGVHEAFALSLLLADAAAVAPHLLPLLLATPAAESAGEAAEVALGDVEAVDAAVVAFVPVVPDPRSPSQHSPSFEEGKTFFGLRNVLWFAKRSLV